MTIDIAREIEKDCSAIREIKWRTGDPPAGVFLKLLCDDYMGDYTITAKRVDYKKPKPGECKKGFRKGCTTEIVCKEMQMLDSRGGDVSGGAPQPQQSAPASAPSDTFDDDIPFANPYKRIEYLV